MDDRAEGEGQGAPKSCGLLITDGTSLRVRGIRLSELPIPQPTFEVSIDMCPHWIGIAVSHLHEARAHHETVIANLNPRRSALLAVALEQEFRSAMQAIVAAAVGIDALYASIRQVFELPPELPKTWRKNRTPRYAQVAETFRRAFSLNETGGNNLRSGVKEIYRFRDYAVHPPAKFSTPEYRQDIERATEWRFVAFSYGNAFAAVHGSLVLTKLLLSRPVPDSLVETQGRLARQLQRFWTVWETDFGPLTAEPLSE